MSNLTPTAPAIAFENVSKSYPIYGSPGARLKELLAFNRLSFHTDFWALRDISFQINRGETFCVIGENGSGKSTLLQILAGILQPTTGSVAVNGRVAALLELGSGFNPEFTGRDNVFLNGAILGLSQKEMETRYPLIEAFAEIGDFIHQPVKTYSSGMAVRLAFAVAIHVDPEILLVDEALSVGDIYFRQRCMRKVHELRDRGVTILFVSHAMADVKQIGNRAMWLDHGSIREIGQTDEVVSKYLAAMAAKDSAYLDTATPIERASATPIRATQVATRIPNVDHRHGDARAQIIGIDILDSEGASLGILTPGSTAVVRISAQSSEPIAQPNIGFMLRNHLGIDFAGSNTLSEGHPLPPLLPGDVYTVDFHLDIPQLYPGTFSFSPAIADGPLTGYKICDWIDNALTLPMAHCEAPVYGYMRIPCRVEFNHVLTATEAVR